MHPDVDVLINTYAGYASITTTAACCSATRTGRHETRDFIFHIVDGAPHLPSLSTRLEPTWTSVTGNIWFECLATFGALNSHS